MDFGFSVQTPDHKYTENIIQQTYGNFGSKSSKSTCFGLNTYTGNKIPIT